MQPIIWKDEYGFDPRKIPAPVGFLLDQFDAITEGLYVLKPSFFFAQDQNDLGFVPDEILHILSTYHINSRATIRQFGIILAGGYLRQQFERMFGLDTGETDFDLFIIPLEKQESLETFRKESLTQIQRFIEGNYDWEKIFECETNRLISYKSKSGVKIQFICHGTETTTSPYRILQKFDFLQTRAALWSQREYFTMIVSEFPEYLKSIAKRELIVRTVCAPVATLARMEKYQKKGYDIKLAREQFSKYLVHHGWKMKEMGMSKETAEAMLDFCGYID